MLKISTREESGAAIISVSGEVDLYSSPDFRTALLKMTEQKGAQIIVDLADVPYMDSSGLATLVEGYQKTTGNGGSLAIVNLQKGVREVFELSNLDQIFDIFDTIADALGANGAGN